MVFDDATWHAVAEGLALGAPSLSAVAVAVTGVKKGLKHLQRMVDSQRESQQASFRELVRSNDLLSASMELIRQAIGNLETRLSAVELSNAVIMGIHHPESLETVVHAAEEVVRGKEALGKLRSLVDETRGNDARERKGDEPIR